jgi:hypothetical protein
MAKGNTITCMSFDNGELNLAVVNPLIAKIERRISVRYDYNPLESGGSPTGLEETILLIKKTFEENDLPNRVKISLGLNYLELKQLLLPLVPHDELDAIVRDEAVRESVFSYSGENVAVVYQTLGRSIADARPNKQDIFTASAPQRIIDNLFTICARTNLQILAIQPSLIGLDTAIARSDLGTGAWKALLYITESQTEFYVWEKDHLQFWRAIPVGASSPDELQQEVAASLEHFHKKLIDANAIEEILLCGEPVQIDIGPQYTLRKLSNEKLPVLYGLGLSRQNTLDFANAAASQQTKANLSNLKNLVVPALVVLLLLAGIASVRWGQAFAALGRAEKNVKSIQASLTEKEQQLQQLQQNQGQIIGFLSGDLPIFMDRLRRIVPSNLRFNSIELLPDKQQMNISGICIRQMDLTVFINELAHLKGISSINQVSSEPAGGESNKFITFKIQVTLGGL